MPKFHRLQLASITLLILLSLTLFLSIGQPDVFAIAAPDSGVTIHFIDVGQGDSIFIDYSGLDVLIDGGPRTAGTTVVNYLNSLNITRLGLVVATHMDADHIGGLINVLNSSIQVDKVLINNQSSSSQTYNQFITLAQNREVIVAQRGQVYILTSTVNLTVFNPTQPRIFNDQNENSVVIKLQAGQTSFLLEGDAESGAEQDMINAGLNLRSDVLKVGHHGSTSSTTEPFLDGVKPAYAIISCALVNTYGHPAPSILQRLADHNVTTYGTYTYSTIIATTDGNTITFTNTNPQKPIPTPTSTATSQPTATPSPTTTASPIVLSPHPSPTASIPEFPTFTAAIIVAVISISLFIAGKKYRFVPRQDN